MTVQTQHYVVCDNCKREQNDRYPSVTDARAAAHDDGWITRRGKRGLTDRCWYCIEEEHQATGDDDAPDLLASIRNRRNNLKRAQDT